MSKDKDNIIKAFSEFLDKHFGESNSDSPNHDVIKSVNEELKQALHVVYQPNTPDLHGEWMSEETIRKACHSFNLHCRKANLFHRVETDKVEIVESYILPTDTEINGTKVVKGSWLAVLQYKDDELWEMEKSNDIQGISIGARGKRVIHD